jgi:DNA-binding response OmpR family regulator
MESQDQPLAEPKDKCILIVDDDESIRELLEMGAREEGFMVATAVDGAMAAQVIKEIRPSLIITDLMMPAQGGFELIRSLQETDLRSVPIIMITGRKLDDSTKEMIRQEGNVVQVLAKPLSLSTFRLTLHQVLHTKPPQIERS